MVRILYVPYTDIASFTSMCGQVPPHRVMAFLNDLFTTFDQLVEKHQVYKESSSVTEAVDPLHAHKVFAFAALEAARCVMMPGTGQPVRLRVGIHSGPVMSGIVGRKMPRFCLFGDTADRERERGCRVFFTAHTHTHTHTHTRPLQWRHDEFLHTDSGTGRAVHTHTQAAPHNHLRPSV
ncbi:guanylyl and adenylyl cyclase family member [Volvox carteri f. nagariensis]|uniref:Guanylyl and adenylyl cyclase family member n=1 Tax=Volvox carteri f. nagariensis TaxID=3068 RepID=D8UGI8_VOLCA|nr:guanylyl and adenylyl cyclase family member [Volvox carteri f. nagariensis]EFJ41208.1 guanylyl and adenylyl cyclase family member [Volvox carteri f. nagariensis]|eukprot:XP_002957776.1 guanylyl and adenylyl cyclase family member [Volvox carteri f. nagariensis]